MRKPLEIQNEIDSIWAELRKLNRRKLALDKELAESVELLKAAKGES